ncbi:MAG: formylglycine-generating enzyme family protein [Rivularia sp. (in: cyanobacteria)]
MISQQQETQRAEQMVERFVRRFQPSYKVLACHAALPLVLTPELLNFLRVQFLRGEVPWVAEVDLLLSDLCRQVEYELYAMDTAVRAYLLEEMNRELGSERMKEVARLLISYVKHIYQNNPYISPKELQAQQWAAMVYIEPETAAREIAQDFQSTAIGRSLVNRAEIARLAKITQELAPQLNSYAQLVRYAQLVSQVLIDASGVEESALRRSYFVAGVELSLPEELIPQIPEIIAVDSISQSGLQQVKTEGDLPPWDITEESASINLQNFIFETATTQSKKSDIGKGTEIIIHRQQQENRYFIEDLGNGITLEMVYIPGDTFTMGAPQTEKRSKNSERPQHQVSFPTFFMSKYPITQAQWQAVANLPQIERELKPQPSHFKGDNRPIEQISWYDAVEFCARLSNRTGKEYHLPSEAEWEYACRAGTTTPFHFGETITGDLANYDASMIFADELKGELRQETTPVGQFPPNAFGLYDMHGNVWEWCLDNWHDNYEGATTDGSAWIEADENENNHRVLRGGSWYSLPSDCRSANRYRYDSNLDNYNIGLRVVCGIMI